MDRLSSPPDANGHRAVSGSGRDSVIPRPDLFSLLSEAGRVAHVSAPPGCGKTVLLRSWIAEAGLSDRVAWVSVERIEHDPQAFWLSVAESLRRTRAGSPLVRDLTASPGLDSWTIVERLVDDLGPLGEPLWLVIDDLHELGSEDAIRQLAFLLQRGPGRLRFVLSTRRDLPLGLHRLRLEGEVTELRAEDLRFSAVESRALFERSGLRLSDSALKELVGTTEGWAAGLRLAALSMARHPDPERFASTFGGHERNVAEYLFAEVLQSQSDDVRRLLLRTSVLERVSGSLADHLTGSAGAEEVLSELEEAGAFVVALDAERVWFRYHHLFKDLLYLELRRTAPGEIAKLHRAAANWHAEFGHPVEAIRHAQAGEDWDFAAKLLVLNWFGLYLDGRQAVARQLIAAFPESKVAQDPELAALAAFNEWAEGSATDADRYLAIALRVSTAIPDDRKDRLEVALSVVRLSLATTRNDIDAVTKEVQRLTAPETRTAVDWHGNDLNALALTDIGIAQIWTGQLNAAEVQLERALVETRRVRRPVLEVQVLAHWALVALAWSLALSEQRALEAIEVAQAHGWERESSAAVAQLVIAVATLLRGRFEEAEQWLVQAELGIVPGAKPTIDLLDYGTRALLEFACGRHQKAMAAYRDYELGEQLVVSRHLVALRFRLDRLTMMTRLGRFDEVQQALDRMGQDLRDTAEMRMVAATLRLAQGKPDEALAAIAPVVDGPTPPDFLRGQIQALLLEASARAALGDGEAAADALERALDFAEPDGLLLPFLLVPLEELLERHRRSRTKHASLISEATNLSLGKSLSHAGVSQSPVADEPLSESELRVLRYLPTNLQAQEIASELFVSVNTVRTHMRHLYSKLDVHSRGEAVERARNMGLLSRSQVRH